MISSIHHVCKSFFPSKGGIEVVVDAICRSISSEYPNIQNRVITCRNKGERLADYEFAEVRSVKSLGVIASMPIAPKIVCEVWSSFKTGSVIFLHYPFPLSDFSTSLFCFYKKPKLVVYWHSNIVSQRILRWLVFPFTLIMLQRANIILVASPNMVEHSKLLSFFRKKVEIVPYSLPAKKVTEFPEDGDYFLAIGRHVEYKGFIHLIRAMALTNQKLIIVGDGPLAHFHQREIDRLGLSARVTLQRKVSDEQKDKYIANCKALVLPSIYRSEAFALVQLEAMRYGKPVINTLLESGVPWVARNGLEGITVEPKCSKSLAKAMNQIARDKQLRERLSVAARVRFEEQFQLSQFKNKIYNVLVN